MKLNCQHCKTTEVDESNKLACGRIICDDCLSTNASKKRFKCSECNSFHPILSSDEASASKDSPLNNEFKSILNEIQTKLTKTEFDLQNGENLIKEHCIELRRQVQLANEVKIQEINKLGESMINEIDIYEKESLETYAKINKESSEQKLNQLKQEVTTHEQNAAQLKAEIDNQTLDKLKELKSKVFVQENHIKHSVFHKGQLMVYQSNENEFDEDILGLFSFDKFECTVDMNELAKKDFSSAFNRLKADLGDSITLEVLDTKILPNNDFIVLFHKIFYDDDSDSTRYESVFLYLLDQNGRLKRELELEREIEDDIKLKGKVCVSKEKICINYEQDSGYLMETYDLDLNLIKQIPLSEFDELVGANDEKIYVLAKRGKKVLRIYNWDLEKIGSLGQSANENNPHYFPKDLKKLFTLESNCKRYFVYMTSKKIQIVDESTGGVIRTINEDQAIKIDVDSNNNILVFKSNNEVVFFNSDGFYINKIEISSNKSYCPLRNFYANKTKNTLYYFNGDSYEFALVSN